MASKKQEQKHEQILRSLLALPENKKCADCTAKHPSYANVSLNTFVCTTCAGLHREFSHRVKSVSVARFTPEEIKALQEGGNEVARQYWLKNWNPSKWPEPDSSDTEKTREFLKAKYVDKKWLGSEKTTPKTTSKKGHEETEEVRVEPLTKILGKDIPPITVNSNAQKSANWDPFGENPSPVKQQAHEEFNPFGASSSQSQSPAKPQTQQEFNPFGPSSTQSQSHNELSSIFGSQPQSNGHQQQFQPFQQPQPQPQPQPPQPNPDQKAKDLQSQLGSLYQQSAQVQSQLMQQQWMLLNQQMYGGQQGQQGMHQQGMQGQQVYPQGFGQVQGQQGFHQAFGQQGAQGQGFGQQGMQGFGQQGMQGQGQGLGSLQGLQGLQGFGGQSYGQQHLYQQQQQLGHNPYLSEPLTSTPAAPAEPEKPNPFGALKDVKPVFTKKTTTSGPPSNATSPTLTPHSATTSQQSTNLFDDNPFGIPSSTTASVSVTSTNSNDLFLF